MRIRLVLTIALVLGASACYGQSIVEENGTANPFISAIKRASEEFPGDFPVLSAAEPEGSVVVASGDFRNADISIIVEKSRLDSLKPRVRELLAKLNQPLIYVRVRRGRVIGSFDLEFNAYIDQRGNHSHSIIPLGVVVEEVRHWNMPQPLGVAVRGNKNFAVSFRGEKVEGMKLFWPKDVSPTETVEVSADRHWYGLVVLILFVGTVIGSLQLVNLASLKGPVKLAQSFVQQPPKTLAEAQARYDKKTPHEPNPFMLGFHIALTAMFVLTPFGVADAVAWMPAKADRFAMWIFPVLLGPLVVRLIVHRIRKGPSRNSAPDGVRHFMPR